MTLRSPWCEKYVLVAVCKRCAECSRSLQTPLGVKVIYCSLQDSCLFGDGKHESGFQEVSLSPVSS